MTSSTTDTPTPTDDLLDVIVIGAGQAGLATAYHLKRRGLRFLVVDSAPEIGHAWRSRWDTLRLFTAAQYDALPGMAFPAPADSYPTKDEAADYLVEYAHRFDLPVLLNCTVQRLVQARSGGFAVHTSQGRLVARQIVVATGPFQRPVVPVPAQDLDDDVVQLHSSAYRNPAEVPPGRVTVVGAGNSGRQIALELAATHDVTLAVGTESTQLPQRFLGRDLFWWLTRLGVITKTDRSPLARRMRARGDLVIGTPMRKLRRAGVTIRPRLTSADSVPAGSTVVWATGFARDYSWIDVPGVVDNGQVVHHRGITEVPGLSFIGLPWQHTRGSALLGFVQHDAAWLADRISRDTDDSLTEPALKEYVR
jgi:putative flavoprotein involved in K+ transport